MYEIGKGDTLNENLQDDVKGGNAACGIPPAHPGTTNHSVEQRSQKTEDKNKSKLGRSESLPELTTKLHNEAMKIKKWKTSSDRELKQKETELDEVRHAMADQDEYIEQLQMINRQLEAKVEEMEEAIDESHSKTEQCKSCSTVKSEFFKLEERMAECGRERDALKDTDRIRRENFEELLDKYRIVSMENEELKIQVRQEQEECQKVIHEFHVRQESFSTLKEQMNIVSEKSREKDLEIIDITRKLADSVNKNTILDEEYGVLHNILKETEEVVKSQQDQLNFCHSALKRSHAEISKLNETKLQLLKQCEEYHDKDRDMQTTLRALNDNISELAGERQTLWDRITELNNNVKEKKKKIAEVKKDLKHHKKLIKKVSGVANQQADIQDDDLWSLPVHVDRILDELDDDLYVDGPLASSPRNKLSLWQQGDNGDGEEPDYNKVLPSGSDVDYQHEERNLVEHVDQNSRYHTGKRPFCQDDDFYQNDIRRMENPYHMRENPGFEKPIHPRANYESNGKSYRHDDVDSRQRRKSHPSNGRKESEISHRHSMGVSGNRRRSSHAVIDKENVSPYDVEEQPEYSDPGMVHHSAQRRRVRRLSYSGVKDDVLKRQDNSEDEDTGVNLYTAPRRKSYYKPEEDLGVFDSGSRRASKTSSAYQVSGNLYSNTNNNKENNKLHQNNSNVPTTPPFTDEPSEIMSESSHDACTTGSSDKTESHAEYDGDELKSSPMSNQQGIDAEGVLLRKHEMESYILRSQNRGWQRLYVIQKGKFLTFYEDQELMYAEVPFEDSPLNLTNAQITVATDYTKKKHVFRVRLPSGAQYLFQARDHCEMMYWLCTLDAASHDPDVATAPYGANYPLHIMENASFATLPGGKVSGWKKFLQNTMSPLKKK